MRTLSTLLFICLLTFLFAGTTYTQWVQTSLDSGSVKCFAVSGTNLFMVATYRYFDYLFLTTDNGTNWTKMDTSFPINALAVSGTNLVAGTSYAPMDGGGVALSTDNGTSWSAAGLQRYSVQAFTVSGTNIFAGYWYYEHVGVSLSTNNGASWTEAYLSLEGYARINALAISDTSLFAGCLSYWGCRGVSLSTDKGTTWMDVSSGLTSCNVRALAISDTNLFAGTNGGVFLSTNNGTIWTEVNSGLTNTNISVLAIRGAFLFAGTDSGVYLSANNGTNWSAVNSGLTDPTINALAIGDSFLFAGTQSGVWRRPLSEMITSVEPVTNELPHSFSLFQNFPNPFNPSTTIGYQLPRQGHVTLKVFDVLGREVATLVNGVEEPGYKSVRFYASKLTSGVYYYRLQAGNYNETKKLLLLR